ncbi:hypothetical protein ACFL2V_06445 [Pseudomonadota bacterium]
MFHQKTVKLVGHLVAAYLLIKILLTVVMYVWALFGIPPLPIINPEAPNSLLALGDTIAIYIIEIAVVGLVVKYLGDKASCPSCPPCVCPTTKAAKKPAKKRSTKKK